MPGAESDPAGGASGLRVLVVSGLYPKPGSPLSGLFVHRQVEALRQRAVDVRVVCPVARPLLPFGDGGAFASRLDGPRNDEVEGVPVTYVPYRHVPHRLSTRLEAASLVRSLRTHLGGDGRADSVDLLHGHWLFPAGWATTVLASDRDVPAIVTAHGSDVHRYPAANRGTARFTRRTLERADAAVAVCRDLAGRMRALAGDAASPAVVYNGVDARRFQPPADREALRRGLGLPVEGTGICSVTRLVAEKGVPELFRAFRRLAEERPELWLALVGEGALLGDVGRRARDAGLADRVFLPGAVPHAEVPSWLGAADVFALPSHAEGLPVSVLEAMACGLPVAATSVGGVPEAVDDEVGRLVALGEPGRLADALGELVADPGLRDRLGGEARRRVERSFTWSRSAERLADVYRDVVDRRGRPAASGRAELQPSAGGRS